MRILKISLKDFYMLSILNYLHCNSCFKTNIQPSPSSCVKIGLNKTLNTHQDFEAISEKLIPPSSPNNCLLN